MDRTRLGGEAHDIAIIGIGCRFPGASGPEPFWELLRAGRSAVGEVPSERWDAARLYDSELSRPGTMNTRWGAFLEGVYRFDAGFFGISPGEAAAMDPQQRLLLEVSWEALEHAALLPRALSGSRTGIFIGQGGNDYSGARFEELASLNAYWVAGNSLCMLANRLSYFYDLTGPSLTVDTGCSASLVAVHMACESLRRGETSLALAGGVNLIFSPRLMVGLSQSWMMSADGRCKSFDARADGYVRGEGCGLVVLKRLEEALADGDHIWAVVRGSAVNQGGRGKNLTAPNEGLQVELIRAALEAGGVPPEEVDYIEAHGVGTPTADLAEARALAQVFGARQQAPRFIGSVKPNIGHLEPAAGIASLIKTVLALAKEELPPQVHFESLHPEIARSGFDFTIPLRPTPWPCAGRPARAGVNSFGLGGSNAHVVLEAPPQPQRVERARSPLLLTLSSRSEAGLRTLAARYQEWLEARPGQAGDLCFTSRTARHHFTHRLGVEGADAGELRARLGQWLSGEEAHLPRGTPREPGVVSWRCAPPRALPSLAPGQLGLLEEQARALGASWFQALTDSGATDSARSLAWHLLLWDVFRRVIGAPGRLLVLPGGELSAAVLSGLLPPERALELASTRGGQEALLGAAAEACLPGAEVLPLVRPDGSPLTAGQLLASLRWDPPGPGGAESGRAGSLEFDPLELLADGGSPDEALFRKLAAFYVQGVEVGWGRLEPRSAWRRCAGPIYVFEQREFGRLGPPRAPAALPAPAGGTERAPAAAEVGRVRELVLREVASVLGREPVEVASDRGFFSLGMSSLMALDLKNRLQQRLGEQLPLPATVVFEHPDVDSLSHYIARGRLAPSAGALLARAAAPSPSTGEPGAGELEPIAIVGMGCRFPGGADSPEAFWKLLMGGQEAIREVPGDRWDVDAYYSANVEAPGKVYTRRGGFLNAVDQFDPLFFGISAREAESMDPQQRLVLEVAWEALEHAGIPPHSLAGAPVGVFMGVLNNDYLQAHVKLGSPSDFDAYALTGTLTSAVAGRLSFVLKVRGPSVALDTACSSSLVTVHLACQSLRSGESRLALAGGVNLILSPELSVGLSRARAISPDGRCKTFDAAADGYARGEGCGVVVLKRLSHAIADGDRIYALVRGSAINHDGASSGFTVPSAQAQKEVIQRALEVAGVAPSQVDLVEAHGTGTRLGDPIEVQALAEVLGQDRPKDSPLLLGSVKTHIGHLEAAAGIAGLIKVALALGTGEVPPHLNFHTPNPLIPWKDLPVEVPTRPRAWGKPPEERLAGVSSFGMSGMNAHVVLQGHAPMPRAAEEEPSTTARLVVLSGRSESGLRVLAGRLAEHLEAQPSVSVADVCWTLSVGRGHHEHRAAALVRERGALVDFLRQLSAGEEPPGLYSSDGPVRRPEGVALVFPGTGLEPRQLLALRGASPRFRRDLEELIESLARQGGEEVPPLARLLEEPGLLEARPELDAPLRFAVEHSLARLFAGWGIPVAGVRAHGMGLLAAACFAGQLPLVDGLRLAVAVGRAEGQGRHGASPEVSRLGELAAASGWREGPIPLLDGETGAVPAEWLWVGREPERERASAGAEGAGWRWSPGGGGDPWEEVLAAAGALYVRGHALDWRVVEPGPGRRPIPLPTYPFQRQRCWPELLVPGRASRPPRSTETPSAPGEQGRPLLMPLAAGNRLELEELARSYRGQLSGQGLSAQELALKATRELGAGPHRAAVLAHSEQELAEVLEALLAGEPHPGLVHGTARVGERPRVVFVFPGHGTQSVGMARELLEREAGFHEALSRVDAALRPHLGWSVLEELVAEEGSSRLGQVEVVQPCLFAVGVALATLWRRWGVEPEAVVGHSMGEIIAAHVAGVLSLEDAALLISRRSELLGRVRGKGAMLAVEATAEEARAVVADFEGRASVALLNGPRSTVISGEPEAIEELARALRARGLFARRVRSDVAFHSPQMEPLSAELREAVREIRPGRASIPLYSTVEGRPLEGTAFGPEYWARNLRQPVLFSRCTEQLLADGLTLFLEVSPHPVLAPAVEPLLRAASLARPRLFLSSLERKRPERWTLLHSAGEYFVRGGELRWDSLYPPGRDGRPWGHPRAGVAGRQHPLLGSVLLSSREEGVRFFEVQVSASEPGYLSDHRINGAVLFPATGYLEMVHAALGPAPGGRRWCLEAVVLGEALVLSGGGAVNLQLALAPLSGGRLSWSISSWQGARWVRHAEGAAREAERTAPPPEVLSALRERLPLRLSGEAHAEQMARRGLTYGPRFRGVRQVWCGGREALAEVALPEPLAAEAGQYGLHPVLLDACLQVVGAVVGGEGAADTLVPVGFSRVEVLGPVGSEVLSFFRLREVEGSRLTADVSLLGADGGVLAEISGFQVERLEARPAEPEPEEDGRYLAVEWSPQELEAPGAAAPGASWLVLGEAEGLAQALERRLLRSGARCVRLDASSTASREQLERRLRATHGEAGPRGVLDLRALDAPAGAASGDVLQGLLTRCGALLDLTQALASMDWREVPRLYVLTRGAQSVGQRLCAEPLQAALWGMGRTLAAEHPEWQCTRMDLEPGGDVEAQAEVLLAELVAEQPEEEVALAGGLRWIARLRRRPRPWREGERLLPAEGRHFRLEGVFGRGRPRACWREVDGGEEVGPQEVEVQMLSARLEGEVEGGAPRAVAVGPGGWVGVVTRTGAGVDHLRPGQRVLGLVAAEQLASHRVCAASVLRPLPEGLDAHVAAASLGGYLAAAYALRHVVRLEPGERVAVRGDTAEGMAVALLARRQGAEVLALTRSRPAALLLRSRGVETVDLSAEGALQGAGGPGGRPVDVLFDGGGGLADELEGLELSADCRLVEFSRAREVGRMAERWRRRVLSLSSFDAASTLGRHPERLSLLCEELLPALAGEELPPLPGERMPAWRVPGALRDEQGGARGGVVDLSDRGLRVRVSGGPAAAIRGEATYLITGGLGGLGLSLAESLVREGARHLVLLGRSGPKTPAQHHALEVMRQAGAEVRVELADAGDAHQLAQVLARLGSSLPPLRGVVHAAGVLDDALLEQQSRERLRRVMVPKALGAWNLHLLTRELPLDFFILYSSAGALLGLPGQLNYAAANAFLDALAHWRRSEGLPALSINWGAWAEVGMAAAEASRGQRLADRGLRPIAPGEGNALFHRLLLTDAVQVGVAPVDFRQWVEFHPQRAGSSLLSELLREARQTTGGSSGAELMARLSAVSGEQQVALLEDFVQGEVARLLRFSADTVGRETPLLQLGMDSLVGLELRNRLEAELGIVLAATLVWTYPTIRALAAFLRERLVASEPPPPPPPPVAKERTERLHSEAELDQMSDEELAALGESLLS